MDEDRDLWPADRPSVQAHHYCDQCGARAGESCSASCTHSRENAAYKAAKKEAGV